MIVFHLDDTILNSGEAWSGFRGRDTVAYAIQYWDERRYRVAAYVRGDDVDTAFHLTNHIDQSWTDNNEVVAASGPQRSTSVGDMVMTDDGIFHLCCPFGWETVGIGLA